MLFFYRYNRLVSKHKQYVQSTRVALFSLTWSKWFLVTKFNLEQTSFTIQITGWLYRSLYTNRYHFNNLKTFKKAICLHLFWIGNVWQLAQPLTLKGVSKKFPIMITAFLLKDTHSLEIYSHLLKWTVTYGLNKDQVFHHKVTTNWLKYKPYLWMKHSYRYYVDWRLKTQRVLRTKKPVLWFLNHWYLQNYTYHKIQGRFFCLTPITLPLHYTKTIWLRLIQYPCLYNYRWFKLLKFLSLYKNQEVLPWPLLYQAKRVWMFDYRARSLALLLKTLVTARTHITEYILIKRWQDLLKDADTFSTYFQIKIRNLALFREFLKNNELLN